MTPAVRFYYTYIYGGSYFTQVSSTYVTTEWDFNRVTQSTTSSASVVTYFKLYYPNDTVPIWSNDYKLWSGSTTDYILVNRKWPARINMRATFSTTTGAHGECYLPVVYSS